MNATLQLVKEWIRLEFDDNLKDLRSKLDDRFQEDHEAIELIDLYFKEKPKIIDKCEEIAANKGAGYNEINFEYETSLYSFKITAAVNYIEIVSTTSDYDTEGYTEQLFDFVYRIIEVVE